MSGPPDEFAWIASLRPLTGGDPAALGLLDDAAVLPSRPGFDLVISKDAMVEGVHFLAGEAPDVIARRLIRVSLSDLAAKAAAPFGYFLMTAWPTDRDRDYRAAFAAGLAQDGAEFGISLLGGDTVSAPGPLVLSATVLGWVPQGAALLRSGARGGDVLIACGAVGDGWLGLKAARGEISDPGGRLADRYRLPTPLLCLQGALRAHARAAADVSDGLLADAGHIAEASGLAVDIDLDDLNLSAEAKDWLDGQADKDAARLALAAGGDDYAIVCAIGPADEAAFIGAVGATGVAAARAGRFMKGAGVTVRAGGAPIRAERLGWRH